MNANLDTQPGAATRPLYWSVRREVWENRSIYIAPLIAAGIVILSYAIGSVAGWHRKHEAPLTEPFDAAVALIILTTIIVSLFYCLDALYGERRDRSILFWKSLPVSDLTTVVSKAIVPLLVLPLVAFAIIEATHLILLLLSIFALPMRHLSIAMLWDQLPLSQMPLVTLYLLATLVLWYAPIYGWLLLVSAWARRATFLWAVLPPLAICAVERVAFNTTHLTAALKYRLVGSLTEAFVMNAPEAHETHEPLMRLAQLDPVRFLSSPALWIGLLVAAAFLVATIRLRRYRSPI